MEKTCQEPILRLECQQLTQNTNLLLTEREGRTGEYWPEVVAVRTERICAKTTEGQCFPVWHSDHACFEFAGFRKQKIRSL